MKLKWGINLKLFHFFTIILVFAGQTLLKAQSTVDSLSFQSLKIELYRNNENIGSATGLIVEKHDKYYLITNLHVVTGLDYFSHAVSDSQLRIPNIVAIWQNTSVLGIWTRVAQSLYDNGNNKQWIEVSVNNKALDLVALPLTNIPDNVKLYPLHLNTFNDNLLVLPGFSVSIIGFPYGLSSAGRFAIWKTGHMASDFDINTNDSPEFLIDATTRPGMSGSIVVIRMSPYMERDGTHVGIGTRFLGIYTAQSNSEELGYVLKPIVLKMLFDKLP